MLERVKISIIKDMSILKQKRLLRQKTNQTLSDTNEEQPEFSV